MTNPAASLQIGYGVDPITVIVLVAKSHDDRDEWVTLLRTLCRGNPTTPVAKYHPALYQSGKWNCCGETSKMASGCEPVTWVANRIKTESTSIRSAGNTTPTSICLLFVKQNHRFAQQAYSLVPKVTHVWLIWDMWF